MAAIVLPRDNSLQQAIMGILAQAEQRRAQQEQLNQQQQQFDQTMAMQKPLVEAQTGAQRATGEKYQYDVASDRASKITAPIIANYNAIMANGGDAGPANAFAYISAEAERRKDDPEVFAQLSGFTNRPTLPTDLTAGNVSAHQKALSDKVRGGTATAQEYNEFMKMTYKDYLPPEGLAGAEQRETGKFKEYAAIKGGQEADAEAKLTAKTNIQTTGMQTASQERQARIQAGATVDAAGVRSGATNATPAEQNTMRQEAATLIDELIAHPGLTDATGMSGGIARRVPGTDAAGFVAKVNRLKSLMTFENLKALKGAMSDKDLLFLQSIPAALEFGMDDDEFLNELQRVKKVLGSDAVAATPKNRLGLTPPQELRNRGSIQ